MQVLVGCVRNLDLFSYIKCDENSLEGFEYDPLCILKYYSDYSLENGFLQEKGEKVIKVVWIR